ncbi:TonB-dependent siderophore receptor [Acinetobacter guillouiae]|uniref:TonB-dependent siderophore receptor n=1 Tax=Acinetobacter TaxID=469 RepID=UPI001FBAD3BC|nr:TonB-dependent siderophore receptor [Acinetobacter sp. NyZ410]UOH20354.1 TonB-dependent siderophore receptor [Acinetobacter sp. NyZ410]
MKEHQSKHALAIAIRTAIWGGSIFLIHGSVVAAPNPSDGQEQNSTQLPTITVSANNTNSLTTEGSGLYTAKATTASTGLALSLKETPQSVSVMTQQRMQDQNLTQLTDVANQVAGLTVSQSGNVGSDTSPIYSRGKSVDSYLLDGVKLLSTYSSIFQSQDTALFDRIEVVRGATGLMTGAGSASASINMVRKKPLQDFKASISTDLSSWDSYRFDGDISTPLNQSGTLRGRAVVAYQNSDSYIDRFNEERKVAYAVVDTDLSDKTQASLGLSYQQIYITGQARGGLPAFYSDGTRTNWSRSDSAAPSWSYSDRTTTSLFADVNHQFNDNWKLKASLARIITDSDELVGYASGGTPNKQTGSGVSIYSTHWAYKPIQDLFNVSLNGSFDLLNQTHDVIFGSTLTRSENSQPYFTNWWIDGWSGNIDNIYKWDGNTPERPNNPAVGWTKENNTSSSFYTAARFKLSDDLALLLGSRLENWKLKKEDNSYEKNTITITNRKEENKLIPYIGVVYDLNQNWSAYASYTNIFSPQDLKTRAGDYIDPLEGNSTELGIKGAFFDNQLNLSAAIYENKEDNFAVAIPEQPDGSHLAPDGSQAYIAESGTKSRGIELEATGKLSDTWQISSSFARNLSRDRNGKLLNSNIPSNTAKLYTTYKLPYLNEAITVGGGIRWQSEIQSADQKFTQSEYSVVDLMARYKINNKLTANLNINNLFDKKYYLTTGNSYYGAPINFRVGLKYDW